MTPAQPSGPPSRPIRTSLLVTTRTMLRSERRLVGARPAYERTSQRARWSPKAEGRGARRAFRDGEQADGASSAP